MPPIGVPKSISLAFWAGLWGLTYAALEPRLSSLGAWWLGGIVYGLALPLMTYWFVALPLNGAGLGGGFYLSIVPIEIGFHAVFGI